MLGDIVGFLECPVCRGGLSLRANTVCCTNKHAFDVARHGYVNLGSTTGGDSAAMVAARAAFLAAGHYAPLAAAVRAAAVEHAAARGCVLDVGAGTGHYLASVLERRSGSAGIAADASKHAARRSARAHPRAGAVVCDTWRRLPVRDGAAALVLDVFAPRNGAELARVLDPEGALLVVTPAADHLGELVAALDLLRVDERKDERLDEQLGAYLTPVGSRRCAFEMQLGHDDVQNLVAMGPSARHVDPGVPARRVAELPDPVGVTASVAISLFARFASESAQQECG